MDAVEVQLHVLSEVVDAFAARGINVWLRGGWALDFVIGRIGPEHADIDLVAWRRDRDAIYETLTAAGFELERELPSAAIDFAKSGQSVQFLLLEFDARGALVCHGFESRPFPERMLDGRARTIKGVTCRTLTPHALLWEKETYESRRGRSLREKDRVSIQMLRQLLTAREEESSERP